MTKNRTGVFYDKVSAERLLLAGLSAPDLKDSDLEVLEKNGPEKYAILIGSAECVFKKSVD